MNKVTITATVLLSTLSLTALASMSTDKKGHYTHIVLSKGEQTKIELSTFGPGTYDVYISDNKDTFYVATVPVNTQTNHRQQTTLFS